MKIEELYNLINSKNVSDNLVIFKVSDSHFLPLQYANEIAKQHNLNKTVVDDIFSIKTYRSAFDNFTEDNLKICILEDFSYPSDKLKNVKNLIVICNKIDKETDKLYSEFIINVPKLENWQVQDFIYSGLPGMSNESLEWLSKICKNDAYRASIEIDRLKIFNEPEREILFKQFKEDYVYDDLTLHTIFDFISAVTTRDVKKVCSVYKDLKNIDSSPIGILALLYNNFRNIISVQCSPSATADSCGLTAKQFWAIKYNINHYTREQLMHIFLTITDLDKQFKTGEIEVEYLLDYLLVDIFSC